MPAQAGKACRCRQPAVVTLSAGYTFAQPGRLLAFEGWPSVSLLERPAALLMPSCTGQPNVSHSTAS